jgi:hypothetical protein
MAMWDWHDDWKISVITREVPTGKEVEAGVSKTPAGDSVVPKNLKPSQKSGATKEGECAKEGCTGRKKGHYPNTREQGVGDTMTQETPSEATPQETRPPKRTIIHTRRVMQEGQGA